MLGSTDRRRMSAFERLGVGRGGDLG